jgi:hypothetical protein
MVPKSLFCNVESKQPNPIMGYYVPSRVTVLPAHSLTGDALV